jgi:hypothetical protein
VNAANEVGDTVAISLNLPTQVAALLQHAFATAGGDSATTKVTTNKTGDHKGKAQIEPINQLSKSTATEKPESSQQAAEKQGSGKAPYCWCCFTKGHGISECNVTMYCPICDYTKHAKACCPKWRGEKPVAITCAYTVEGLGFFQIPHTTAQ